MLLFNATCKLQTKVVVAIKIVINDELALVALSYLGFIFSDWIFSWRNKYCCGL
jgi:hypothetical protein